MKWLIPPRLLIGLSILMVLADWLAPLRDLIYMPWALLIGGALMVAGICMGVVVFLRFRRVDTEINTFGTPRVLQTDGMFAHTRNPIYLGMLTFLVGLAILLGSASVWFGPLAFFLVANSWYVPHEEEKAAEAFGDLYQEYKKKVRRWV